jgi:hypothetical protein
LPTGSGTIPISIANSVTAVSVYSYWGEVNDDAQMTANATYIQENFLDKGLLGARTGQGYYSLARPLLPGPRVLDVPDLTQVPQIVTRLTAH